MASPGAVIISTSADEVSIQALWPARRASSSTPGGGAAGSGSLAAAVSLESGSPASAAAASDSSSCAQTPAEEKLKAARQTVIRSPKNKSVLVLSIAST